MLSSLFSGVSGMLSNSQSINVIGNNIANVNTVGFKGSRATFADFFYQNVNSSSGTGQIGRGSMLSSVDTIFSQGSFETTASATDLAIGGDGFFVVNVPGTDRTYYTRAGAFRIDKDGYLVTPNDYVVQGRNPLGVVTDIRIQQQASEAQATSNVGMYCNLNANDPWRGTVSTPSGGVITQVTGSNGQYPRAGDYTGVTTLRTASHTGTNNYGNAGGALVIGDGTNTATINLTGGDLASAVTAINAALTAAGVDATASASGSQLTLTGTTAGVDISVNNTGITTGSIGWTAQDRASSNLFGAQLAVTGPVSATAPISVGQGTATNFGGLGLDIQHANINSGTVGTQTYSVGGFDVNNPNATSNWPSAISVYDSLGNPHTVTVYFRKAYEYSTGGTIHSVWEWNAVAPASDTATGLPVIGGSGTMEFDATGRLIAGGEPTTPIIFDFAGANPGQQIDISFVNGPGNINTTQLSMASTTNYQSQDGYPPGMLTNVGVNTDGVITGYYSNGQQIDLYTIVLADFNNPMGLHKEGNNLYSLTGTSGDPFINLPGTAGLGKISPNSLEQSNVDIANEFVKMIISQRGFQANSRVITTSDEMLQEIMSLKR